MLTLIAIEIFKMWKKPRSWFGFAGLFVIVVLMAIGLRHAPPMHHGAVPRGMMVVGSFLTAGFMTALLLQGTFFTLVPLFVSMVAGDMIAGEASEGTLRTAMSRPVSRWKFLGAKFVAISIYCIVLTFFLGVSGYIVGLIALGRGPVTVTWSGLAVYPEGEGIVRLIGAYALACVPMIVVATIALFISNIVNSSPAAIIGPLLLIFGLMVICEFSFFKPFKPYFFTTYMDLWKQVFVPKIPMGEIAKDIGCLVAYIVAFGAAAGIVFSRKDILT